MKKELDEKQLEYVNGGTIKYCQDDEVIYFSECKKFAAVYDKKGADKLIGMRSNSSEKGIMWDLYFYGYIGKPVENSSKAK